MWPVFSLAHNAAMKLLAFETATEACSVAVWSDGRVLERFEIAPRRHAELALPWAEVLLAEAGLARSQLDAIAVGRGPGAFTGVRLGIGVAQGIALALDRPLVAVSTLSVLAAGARAEVASLPSSDADASGSRILAAIDARMGEVYLGRFALHSGDAVALGPEVVVRPEAAEVPDDDGWLGLGTGFAAADGALQIRLGGVLARVDARALPHAGALARLAVAAFARGEAVAPERVEPAYLRNNVALTLVEQRRLRAP